MTQTVIAKDDSDPRKRRMQVLHRVIAEEVVSGAGMVYSDCTFLWRWIRIQSCGPRLSSVLTKANQFLGLGEAQLESAFERHRVATPRAISYASQNPSVLLT